MNYTAKKLQQLFLTDSASGYSEEALAIALKPLLVSGRKSLSTEQVPEIGEKFGFLKKPTSPKVICLFVTKGGVLKSTLALNLARVSALHNIRTCVVGLDMQGDVTNALGFSAEKEASGNFKEILQELGQVAGLNEVMTKDVDPLKLLVDTDIPNLKFIPETPELINLERSLNPKNRREYWLKEKVLAKLKSKFELIILDVSPNWNLLTTNAVVACDFLLSPLECKINNYRNFKVFHALVDELKQDYELNFIHRYIPTRYSESKRLSKEILNWYRINIPNCLTQAIAESNQGEEATAMNLSLAEFASGSKLAVEMNQMILKLFELLAPKQYSKKTALEFAHKGTEAQHGHLS